MPNIINKVVYDGQTLIDLTQDTVTADDVLQGVTVHLADGTIVTGTMIATSTPTADTISKFDSTAHMNSEDMTSQEVDDFVDSLSVHGAVGKRTLLWTNPNPTQGFSATTILDSQDLTIYDEIEVYGINYTTYASFMPTVKIPRGERKRQPYWLGWFKW